MSEAFKKIEAGLKEALAGDISSITIDGVRWLREGFYVHPETLAARDGKIARLRKALLAIIANSDEKNEWDAVDKLEQNRETARAALEGK